MVQWNYLFTIVSAAAVSDYNGIQCMRARSLTPRLVVEAETEVAMRALKGAAAVACAAEARRRRAEAAAGSQVEYKKQGAVAASGNFYARTQYQAAVAGLQTGPQVELQAEPQAGPQAGSQGGLGPPQATGVSSPQATGVFSPPLLSQNVLRGADSTSPIGGRQARSSPPSLPYSGGHSVAPPEEVRKGGDERGSDRQPRTQSSDSETEDDFPPNLLG